MEQLVSFTSKFFSGHLLSTKKDLRVVHNLIVLGQFTMVVIKDGDRNKRISRIVPRSRQSPDSLLHNWNSLLPYLQKRKFYSGETEPKSLQIWGKEECSVRPVLRNWVSECLHAERRDPPCLPRILQCLDTQCWALEATDWLITQGFLCIYLLSQEKRPPDFDIWGLLVRFLYQ